jgi:hypothetical protein
MSGSENLFIILGAFLAVIILLLRFRKFIRLTVTKWTYGEYSFEFFRLYKKYFIRSPFQYCFRDEFVTHLLFVMDKQKDLPTFKSHKDIFFEGTPFFVNYKDFLKDRGEPYCFNAFEFRDPDFIIKALGYQEKVAGSKATLVFYFMNDLFFMGEYIFRNPKQPIKESLVGHFMENETISHDNFFIENTRRRIVHYQDTGFTIDIKYLSEEDDNIMEKLNEYLAQLKNRKVVMQ